ncbi:MAG: hypothetical protein AAFY76_24630, partial [Cyanobacteria bacterium J06649_11]
DGAEIITDGFTEIFERSTLSRSRKNSIDFKKFLEQVRNYPVDKNVSDLLEKIYGQQTLAKKYSISEKNIRGIFSNASDEEIDTLLEYKISQLQDIEIALFDWLKRVHNTGQLMYEGIETSVGKHHPLTSPAALDDLAAANATLPAVPDNWMQNFQTTLNPQTGETHILEDMIALHIATSLNDGDVDFYKKLLEGIYATFSNEQQHKTAIMNAQALGQNAALILFSQGGRNKQPYLTSLINNQETLFQNLTVCSAVYNSELMQYHLGREHTQLYFNKTMEAYPAYKNQDTLQIIQSPSTLQIQQVDVNAALPSGYGASALLGPGQEDQTIERQKKTRGRSLKQRHKADTAPG